MSLQQQAQAAADALPYVSVACRMGEHARCREGVPRPARPAWPVVYETCTCTWCHPRYDRHEGASKTPNSPVLSVTSLTVRPGDVIQVGGRPFKVVDLVALPAQAKRLCFETGETLTMNARTELLAVRMKGRW